MSLVWCCFDLGLSFDFSVICMSPVVCVGVFVVASVDCGVYAFCLLVNCCMDCLGGATDV